MMMNLAIILCFLFCSSHHLISVVIAETEYCTEEGSIKLDEASDGNSYVLICSQGLWGYVCGRDQDASPWTKENVGVACQQLGKIRKDDNVTNVPELSNEEKNTVINLTDVVHYRFIQCTGVEKRLIDCPHGTSKGIELNSCKIKMQEKLVYKYGVAKCTQDPVKCTPGELRIVNNTNTVQICSQGEWYFFHTNENQWTKSQAKVACRQMGLNPNEAKSITLIENSDNHKILNVAFHCEGHENTLSECSSSITEGGTSTIAGVMCGDQTAPPQNVSAIGNRQMITVSWDYDDNDIINSSVIYHVTCTGNSVTQSTIINGTQDMMIQFPGVMPGVEYGCCVEASSPNGGPSETVCDSVSIPGIIPTTEDMYTQTISITDQSTISAEYISCQFNRPTTTLLSGSQSTSPQLTLHSTTTSSSTIRDQNNVNYVSSGQSSSIAWSVGVLVGIVIGMMVVILILLCYTLCYKRFKNKRKTSIKSKTCDIARQASIDNSVELKTGISHAVTIPSGSFIAKPIDPSDSHCSNIYEPIYTDADLPEVDNVYSLLGESEHKEQ